MRLTKARATNFGSYQDLEFDFSDLGITMLTGETGAGKSTLLDIPCWILFGIDSKGGSVDEVRKWGETGPTAGTQEVETPSGSVSVTRVRGEPRDNDLYWVESGATGIKNRGKDILETQRLLDERLGCDGDLYLLAAYLAQFDTTGDFFIATPKARRDIFERLADLTLPIKISERASEHRKKLKSGLDILTAASVRRQGELEAETRALTQAKKDHGYWGRLQGLGIANATKQSAGWAAAQERRLDALRRQAEDYDTDHAVEESRILAEVSSIESRIRSDSIFIKNLEASPICPTCLQSTTPTLNDERRRNDELISDRKAAKERLKNHRKQLNPYLSKIEYEQKITANPFTEKLSALRSQTNPHVVDETRVVALQTQVATDRATEKDLLAAIQRLTNLHDLSGMLRGELLRQTVVRLERQTNKYLEDYFEGELRVSLCLVSGDKLDVEIRKNGHVTTYKRLSGGQRCMLKLAYGIPRMAAAADRAGQVFEFLAFDEALNGLSPEAKRRAYRLFETLATRHSSVLLVDHDSTLVAMSVKRVNVRLESDCSVIDTVDA